MILMYHKVHPDSPTEWWVSVDDFYRQMCEIRCREVVYFDDYDPQNPEQVVITFDGVYKNVLEYAGPILQKFSYPFELFLTGDYLGADNEFDVKEPPAAFISESECRRLKALGGRLQWHTASHANLTRLSEDSEIETELLVPEDLRELDENGFSWFAYPHGAFNERVLEQTKKHFRGAVSCVQGNDNDVYQLNRVKVTNRSTFGKAKTAVIIPCFNYGSFLIEAIESVLRQTRPADEILISDDCSTDNTWEIAKDYQRKYPGIIRLNRNETNLGIVSHFNKAVGLTTSEYVCFLGADNRFRSDYIERTSQLLDSNDELGIAYTDFALFGPYASLLYKRFRKRRSGRVIDDYFHVIEFPDFTPKTRDELLNKGNFIHGSSLFRRKAFEEAGGYEPRTEIPEDYNLFKRIVQGGWLAARVPEALLEYRQHSRDQANVALDSRAELNFYKRKYGELSRHIRSQEQALREKDASLVQKTKLVFHLQEKMQRGAGEPKALTDALKTNAVDLLNNLIREASALLDRGDVVAALKHYDALLQIAAREQLACKNAHFFKAVCLFQLQRYSESLKEVEEELKVDSDNPRARHFFGEVQKALRLQGNSQAG